MRLGFKRLLEMDNIFGQKMTSFELTKLKDAVDEEIFHDMLKEHELYLTFWGRKASELLYDDMVFYAMLRLANKDFPNTKHIKCKGRLVKVKYGTKEEALYGSYIVTAGEDNKRLMVTVKATYASEDEDSPTLVEVPKSKAVVNADDINLDGIIFLGETTKTIVRVK